jgi:hypothetical protein
MPQGVVSGDSGTEQRRCFGSVEASREKGWVGLADQRPFKGQVEWKQLIRIAQEPGWCLLVTRASCSERDELGTLTRRELKLLDSRQACRDRHLHQS